MAERKWKKEPVWRKKEVPPCTAVKVTPQPAVFNMDSDDDGEESVDVAKVPCKEFFIMDASENDVFDVPTARVPCQNMFDLDLDTASVDAANAPCKEFFSMDADESDVFDVPLASVPCQNMFALDSDSEREGSGADHSQHEAVGHGGCQQMISMDSDEEGVFVGDDIDDLYDFDQDRMADLINCGAPHEDLVQVAEEGMARAFERRIQGAEAKAQENDKNSQQAVERSTFSGPRIQSLAAWLEACEASAEVLNGVSEVRDAEPDVRQGSPRETPDPKASADRARRLFGKAIANIRTPCRSSKMPHPILTDDSERPCVTSLSASMTPVCTTPVAEVSPRSKWLTLKLPSPKSLLTPKEGASPVSATVEHEINEVAQESQDRKSVSSVPTEKPESEPEEAPAPAPKEEIVWRTIDPEKELIDVFAQLQLYEVPASQPAESTTESETLIKSIEQLVDSDGEDEVKAHEAKQDSIVDSTLRKDAPSFIPPPTAVKELRIDAPSFAPIQGEEVAQSLLAKESQFEGTKAVDEIPVQERIRQAKEIAALRHRLSNEKRAREASEASKEESLNQKEKLELVQSAVAEACRRHSRHIIEAVKSTVATPQDVVNDAVDDSKLSVQERIQRAVQVACERRGGNDEPQSRVIVPGRGQGDAWSPDSGLPPPPNPEDELRDALSAVLPGRGQGALWTPETSGASVPGLHVDGRGQGPSWVPPSQQDRGSAVGQHNKIRGQGPAWTSPAQGHGQGPAWTPPTQDRGQGTVWTPPAQDRGQGAVWTPPVQERGQGPAWTPPTQNHGQGPAWTPPGSKAWEPSAVAATWSHQSCGVDASSGDWNYASNQDYQDSRHKENPAWGPANAAQYARIQPVKYY